MHGNLHDLILERIFSRRKKKNFCNDADENAMANRRAVKNKKKHRDDEEDFQVHAGIA